MLRDAFQLSVYDFVEVANEKWAEQVAQIVKNQDWDFDVAKILPLPGKAAGSMKALATKKNKLTKPKAKKKASKGSAKNPLAKASSSSLDDDLP